jgi:general secretion pathway protein D
VVNRRRTVGGCLVAGLVAASLAGCDMFIESRTKLPDPFDAIRNTDLQPRFPKQTEASRPPPQGPKGMSFFGREDTAGAAGSQPPPGAQPAASGEGYELNFENAAASTVAKVILGDILGTGYIIDPRVQGTVTISSGRPIAKNDLVFVLENALRMNNIVLVPDSAGYRLIPAAEAQGTGSTSRAGNNENGYGITIVPLRYAPAQTILKLLDSFAMKPGMARADPGRNLILVQGTGPERRAAVETVLSFDVDWMRGQSVGIYPLQNSAPEPIIAELEKIMESGDNGLNHGLVTLQPVARINGVLVVTKKPNLLKTAATWITRLDKTSNAGAAVRVYRLRYGSARQIAVLLNDIFGTRGSSGLDSAVNQIAPGAGVATASSGSIFDQTGTRSGTGTGTGTGQGGLGGTGGFGTGGFGSTGGTSGSSTGPLGSSGAGGGAGGLGGLGAGANAPGQAGAGGLGQQSTTVALPGMRITADTVNNALVIFSSQENYRLIEQTLLQLDRPQLQVEIHATIAEISLTNDLAYGVQYFIQSQDVPGVKRDKGSFGLFNDAATPILQRVIPGFNLLLGPETNPRIILDALRTVTDVKVLSSPSVVVIDNQVAILQVGDQVPITTQSATVLTNPNTPVVNSIDYRNTGVILRVLPRVNANGNVVLDIEQEISNVAPTATANTLTPTLSQRRVKSSIAVASGQSVLLGGLISETQGRNRSGIPVLEELPVIGDAFSHNSRSTKRTELIIFIQPQIIRDSVDAYKVAEELRTRLKGSAETAFPPGPSLRKDPLFVR